MLEKYSSQQIRQLFLDFFQKKEHCIVASNPITVQNDPSLFFVNAGMNSFKDFFLETKQSPYKRIANSQKCLRVSGKHNDLEEVGKDHYHHTMFEMLGNWSFGDYFKKEMIAWAWEFITEVCKIPEDVLYITVFNGDEKDGLIKDEETYNMWAQHIPTSRIVLAGKKDNFWEMGETGPCGPSSEIHIDLRNEEQRKQQSAVTLINKDSPDVIEIWNIVFIQYERKKDKRLLPLKQKYIDTGMGFERLVRVLGRKKSNYDTDLFAPIIQHLETITGISYTKTKNPQDIAFRVIADHLRAIVFTIADGQRPSNTGPGYVIRRILRRAVRYYYSQLAYKSPLLYQLVETLEKSMGDYFPELRQKEYIEKIIKEEETLFIQTLQSGLKRLQRYMNEAKHSGAHVLLKEQTFEMYDTYGFPIDLTLLIAQEQGVGIDKEGFQEELKKQKNRSRQASFVSAEDWVEWNNNSNTSFVGYEKLSCDTLLSKYRKVSQQKKDYYQLVFETTPFYAEGGGQAGDSGSLVCEGITINVLETKKEGQTILHYTNVAPPATWKSKKITAQVDATKRKRLSAHHTATHLLHAALRNVLGKHVVQKGCLLTENKIRFDFSHKAALTFDEIQQIEKLVFQKIVHNLSVQIKTMQKEEALKIGAMALFGEKYEDTVRTVGIDGSFSLELCGGTHLEKTGEVGMLKIMNQNAVASGIRRIEAVAGIAAIEHLHAEAKEWQELKQLFKNAPSIALAAKKQKEDLKQVQKAFNALSLRLTSYTANEWIKKYSCAISTETPNVLWLSAPISLPFGETKIVCAEVITKEASFCFLASKQNGKTHLLLAANKKLLQEYSINLKEIFERTILSIENTNGGGGGNMYSAICAHPQFDYQSTANKIKDAIRKLVKK